MVGLSVAVVCFGAAALPSASVAGADGISSAQAQVQALQKQVVAGAARVRSLTLSYEQANTQASVLAAQVATDQAQVNRLRAQVAATASALRTEAIASYTGGTATTPGDGDSSADPAVKAEYFEVAAGDLRDTADAYRTREAQVGTAESVLATEMRASEAAARAVGAARREALQEAAGLQASLVSVQNRLAQLEAAQQAAAARQAALAAEAMRAAAPAPSATQGLPVNGGLVSVVRTVVAPTPAPSPPAATGGGAGGVWLQLRECESGDNYQENSGNGFFGAYQFSQQTWTGLGYPGRPDLEPPAMQDAAAQKLQAESGWGQWPACSAALGLS